MSNILNIDRLQVPQTARNKRIYTNITTTSTSGSGGGASVDTSLFVKYSGQTTGQTITNDIRIDGHLYVSGDVIAYSNFGGLLTGSTQYTLPIASQNTLGGVRVGANLSIDSNGVLSACAGGLTSVDWSIIENKPATFAPSIHTHSYSSLTGLPDLSQYSLTTHNHSTLYGNLTEVRADVNNPYVDLRFHSPNNDWARIRLEGGSFNFISGGDSNWRDIKAGSIYSSSWFRNSNSGTGLYNEVNETGIYSDASGRMRIYNNGEFLVDNKITTQGAGAALVFKNRNGSNEFAWYAYDNKVQLYNNAVGDILTVHSSGSVTGEAFYSTFGQLRANDKGAGSIELATYAGSLPGYGSSYYPTLKSSGTFYLAASNTYVGYVSSTEGIGLQTGQFKNNANGFKSTNFRGLVGDYDTNTTASKIIWTIGDSWNSVGNMYGIGYDYYNGDHNITFKSNGNFGVRIELGRGSIYGAGSLTMGGEITAYSDAKLKTNLKPITNVLDKIQNIQGYYYTRTDQTDKEKVHIGLIAQEVQKEFSQLVSCTNDTLSLNYQNFTAVLLEAIKEQQKRIEELERRVK